MTNVFIVYRYDGECDDAIAAFTNEEEAGDWARNHPENTGNLEVGKVPLNPRPASQMYYTACPNGCGPMTKPGPEGAACPVCSFTHRWPV